MQAQSLLWGRKALMADSPKLFLYGKIIYFSSQTGFEPKCGGSFQWTSKESSCHPRVMLAHGADLDPWGSGNENPAWTQIWTVKTNAQINERQYDKMHCCYISTHACRTQTYVEKNRCTIPNFCFIFWSFLPAPTGNHYFQPSKYACD